MKDIEKDIDRQIAHIMANYGDEPDTLFYKLRCLCLEWFTKGAATQIMQHQQTKTYNFTCPYCKEQLTVQHLAWDSIKCLHCGEIVKRVRTA